LKQGMMRNADARSTTDLVGFFYSRPHSPRPYHTVPAVEDANYFLTYTGAAAAPDND